MISQIEIRHEISDEIIRFESERGFDSFDKGALIRCLEAAIKFINSDNNSVIFILPDVALLDFTMGLLEACENVFDNDQDKESEIIDFYGKYRIRLSKRENDMIRLENEYRDKIAIDLYRDTLSKASARFVGEVNKHLLDIFPGLKTNIGYNELQKIMVNFKEKYL